MKEIDPSAIPGLYRNYAVTPVTAFYLLTKPDCGCLLGILAVDACGSLDAAYQAKEAAGNEGILPHEALADLAALDLDYAMGLNEGFSFTGDAGVEDTEQKRLGRRHGRAAYQAVAEANLIDS